MIGHKKVLGKAMIGYKMPLGMARFGQRVPLVVRPAMKQVEEALTRKVSGGLERNVLKR
jgi:hypothetical protein